MKYNIVLTGQQLHKLLEERDALRVDVKALAVAAKPFRGSNAIPPPGIFGVAKYQRERSVALAEALARPGVRKVLKGVKDG